ncbi:MAG: galactokinase [Chitinophagaceae bacterium]|nr:galactokinase [Chitinophagaceae bacterium]
MLAIRSQFFNHFNDNPALVVKSPGRINLIGEHTDYNHGFVLPAAIDKYIEVAIAKRTDGLIHMVALDLGETIILPIHNLTPHATQWVNYIIGVVDQVLNNLASTENNLSGNENNFAKIKEDLNGGFAICIQGNIPLGAGLSSSAALECAVLFALNELYQLSLSKMEMALMAQQAEHKFAGVHCGLMDMFASLHGQKNKAILLDCDSLAFTYYPLALNDYSIVLFDTQIKHALASSEYNTRRLECESGLTIIQDKYAEVKTFRDISIEQVEACLASVVNSKNEINEDKINNNTTRDKSSKVYQRCKYVVEEIARVQLAVQDLAKGDMQAFGKKMFETHKGLSKLYEVSCPELDFLVDAVAYNENVLGARMMGGGFGGCTINIIKKSAVEETIQALTAKYAQVMHKELTVYSTSIEEGTQLVL